MRGQRCNAGLRRRRDWLLTGLWGSSTINLSAASVTRVTRCERHRASLGEIARRVERNSQPAGYKEACVRLLIAIPVFNERRYVESVLTEVKRYADEVLCIDDGSTDG